MKFYDEAAAFATNAYLGIGAMGVPSDDELKRLLFVHPFEWWKAASRPYYKVDLNTARALPRSVLNIPCECLGIPLPAFLIRLPVGHRINEFIAKDDGAELQSVLVSCSSSIPLTINESLSLPHAADPKVERCLFVCAFYGVKKETHSALAIRLKPGEILKNEFTEGDPNVNWTALVALVAGVCCIATGNPEFVTREVLSKDRVKLPVATPEEQKRLVERAERRGVRGWHINTEHLIPYESHSDESTTPTGRELNHQHIRSGHFAAVRCGPGRSQAKMVWRKMAIVRPDLPLPENYQKQYRA